MSRFWVAHLALLGANIIYGINYSVAKDVMPDWIEPRGFIMARVIGATILFWLFAASFRREKVAGKDLLKMALCALFGVAINQTMFFEGLNITTPINAAIIMTSNPIIVIIIAALILKERISRIKIGGIALGLVGACTLLLVKSDLSFGSDTLLGDMFILINSTSYAIYLVTVKPLMKKYHPITVIKWVFLFGFIYVLPMSWGQFNEIPWADFPTHIWMETLFVVIAVTFLAYYLNIYALRHLSPSVVSTYLYLQPLIAALIAILWGKDSLDGIKIFSTLLIFSGVWLVSYPGGKKDASS